MNRYRNRRMEAEGVPNRRGPYGIPQMVPMTRVELSLSAKGLKNKDALSKSDPLCIVSLKEMYQDHFEEVERTEMIKDTLDPQWVRKVEIDYRFEERQLLRFAIYDWDSKSSNPDDHDKLGTVECALGEIMASGGSQLSKTIEGGTGVLVIQGDEVSGSKEVVTMNITGSDLDKKDFLGKSDPFLIFYCCNSNNAYVPTHKTEVIKKTLNPVWKPIVVPARILCSGDHSRSIKIECYDWDSDGSHDLIGECYTSLQRLLEGPGSTNVYQLINPKKKAKKSSYKDSGKLTLQSITCHIEPTFLDYIRGGTQLHFTVAVDFTASNGDPTCFGTLHYLHSDMQNQYTLAIRAVGEIIQDYDYDKMFPALGFGGCKSHLEYKVSHDFYLNGSDDNPYCQGVDGILAAYYRSVERIKLYGPTYFTPVITHVANFARAHQDGNHYFVLLIITDGIITDLKATRKALVEASELPMSVIIVGVGDEDFSAMHLLDGDEERLSFEGKYACRDIVQFVEMKKHLGETGWQHSQTKLAKDVLAEIPNQLVSWMRTHGRN